MCALLNKGFSIKLNERQITLAYISVTCTYKCETNTIKNIYKFHLFVGNDGK